MNKIIKPVYKERSTHMGELYSRGFTLKQIGERYSLTCERVRQILNDLDPNLITRIKHARFRPCDICSNKNGSVWYRGSKRGLLCSPCNKLKAKDRPKWSREYVNCIDCNKTTVPHQGHGRCQLCFKKHLYRTDEVWKMKKRLSNARWRLLNPDKVRESGRRASKKQYLKLKQRLLEATFKSL